jgi:hypothetical protein
VILEWDSYPAMRHLHTAKIIARLAGFIDALKIDAALLSGRSTDCEAHDESN